MRQMHSARFPQRRFPYFCGTAHGGIRAGLFTGHDPNLRVGSEKFRNLTGRVGRGRIGSGGFEILTGRVRSSLPDPTRPDLTREV